MKKLSVVLAFFICMHFTAFSQYSVSGKVTDLNGNVLTGANVIITNISNNYGVNTDVSGNYSIKFPKNGTYILKVSFLGFEDFRDTLKIKADQTLDIKLKQGEILADEVVISAIKAKGNMPVTHTEISKEKLREQNMGQDLPYLMALTPSLVTTSDAGGGVGYTNFRIRGTDMNRINITINGIPLNDAESHCVYWVDLPDIASSVENLQIQRGVGTSTQGGGAFGATINLQTLSLNKNPYAEISSTTGSFNTFKNSVSFGTGLLNNHFSVDGRLSKISSDGFIDRASSNLKSFYLSGAYYNVNTLLKFIVSSGFEETYQAWQGVPKAKLKNDKEGMLNYLAVQTSWNEIDGGKADSLNLFNSNARTYNMYTYKNQVDHYNQDHYQLLFSHSFSKTLNFNLALHLTRGKGYYEEYKPRQGFEDYGLENVVIENDTITETNLIRRKWLDNYFYGTTGSLQYSGKNLEIILGGGWNKYDGDHYGRIIWAQYMTTAAMDYQYYFNNGKKTDFNSFLKINYRINNKLSLFGDAQIRKISQTINGLDDDYRDITQSHNFTFFNPKGGFNYAISDKQSFYGYAGIAHREPNRDNFVDADPSKPVPVPERLLDYELGYSYKSVGSQFGVNFYYMDYDNQLVLTGMINDVGNAIMTNVKSSYRTGVELTAAIQFTDFLGWNINATYSQNRINNFTEYIDNYDTWIQDEVFHKTTKLAFSPEIVLGSSFDLNIKKVNIILNSKYVGEQFIDNTSNNDRKLDAYLVNDLKFIRSFKLKSYCSIDLMVNINNILNEEYETNAWVYQYNEGGVNKAIDGYFPQAGRNYQAGLILRF
jgi:iron complex outermembrane recepter protein